MSRGGRRLLPKSLEELKSLNSESLEQLWSCLFKIQPPKIDLKLLRLLWQRVQCQLQNCHLSQKHVTRLNRYSKDPEGHLEKAQQFRYQIRNGVELIKVYKGKRYMVQVLNGRFIYDDKEYITLSAAAKAICGMKVSGNDFFGINNKGKKSRGEPAFEKASV